MSQVAAATAHAEPAETPLTPESWGKLGMWIFLAGDAMSFGVLLASYGALRFASPNWPDPNHTLGITLTAIMTFVLICSSVTMVKALDASKKGDLAGLKRFLALTILGGAFFLGCQAYEWHHLIAGEGMTLHASEFHGRSYDPLFGVTFYILTGFHGCHVLGGVIYLTCVRLNAPKYIGGQGPNGVEVLGLYWHFVDLVWILVFTFIYLLPPLAAHHA